MPIETIAIVHHVHTDFGYTDHQNRCKKEQVKYIDQAVDYVLSSCDYPEGARFAWTQEQLFQVREWWNEAAAERKERFFRALKTGRLEITGTPFNVTAFLSKEDWETAMSWIPDELWNACNISTAMQIDVNGMHTAAMQCAYEKGIRNLWIGPNSYYGVPPLPTPAAFEWQIGGGRKMFVWLNASYNNGTFLFNENWRQGPVPEYADLRYRPAEAGDIWDTSDENMKKSHRMCLENLALIEGNAAPDAATETDGFTKNRVFGGYAQKVLPVSVTNQWRVDNDPPFYPLVDFVRRWNELQLKPRLVLCTASQAMDMVQQELQGDLPVYSGEWIDWWANGTASTPRELAYARKARRVLKTAASDLLGEMTEQERRDARAVSEDICLYYEHSWGSWQSVANPWSFESISQAAEKNIYAYRALDGAQGLLADRARKQTKNEKNAILVSNPADRDIFSTIDLPLNAMRGTYDSILCENTGESYPIHYVDGVANFLRPRDASEFGKENVSRTFSDKCERQGIQFGPIMLPAHSTLRLIPMRQQVPEPQTLQLHPDICLDGNGWPVKVEFEGQGEALIDGVFGELLSVEADGFSPRWTLKDIFENDSPEERNALRKQHLKETEAVYGKTVCVKENGQLRYEQEFQHPSVRYGKRILTLNCHTGTAALELRMDRRSSFDPEVLFLRFDAPHTAALPTVSNAGGKFRPEADQFPGSCKDYYAIDGWICYPDGWLLNCTDNALVSFHDTGVVSRKEHLGDCPGRIFVRLFDNIWDTNFYADSHGLMQFRFQACTGVSPENAEQVADSLQVEPVVVVKMGYPE